MTDIPYDPQLPEWTHGLHRELQGGDRTPTAPQFFTTEIAGEYRAVWVDVLSSYQSTLPFGDPLPPDQRVSNRFMLATERR